LEEPGTTPRRSFFFFFFDMSQKFPTTGVRPTSGREEEKRKERFL